MKDFARTKADIALLPDAKQEVATKLLNKAMFMDAELEKLQKIILKKGWVEEYKNGENQYGLKKSSEGEVYNTLIKNFNSTMKQIADIVGSVASEQEDDELMTFLKGNTKKVVNR